MATWIDSDGNERFRFDFEDMVRMNRNAHLMDLADFENWYEQLPRHLHSGYIEMLFRYGSEYNSGSRWCQVLELAGIAPDDPLHHRLAELSAQYGEVGTGLWMERNSRQIARIACEADEMERNRLAKLAAAYFCVNEKERFDMCQRGYQCTHWWHTDLTDPNVLSRLRASRMR